jgi:hypothetical protein
MCSDTVAAARRVLPPVDGIPEITDFVADTLGDAVVAEQAPVQRLIILHHGLVAHALRDDIGARLGVVAVSGPGDQPPFQLEAFVERRVRQEAASRSSC